MNFSDYIDWRGGRSAHNETVTAKEAAQWLADHPLDDKKEYFLALQTAYENMFHEPMGLMTGFIETYEDACAIMVDCIKSGAPYEADVPEGAII